MTFEAMHAALCAADRLARAHELHVDARFHLRSRCLEIVLRDANERRVACATVTLAKLDACQTAEQLTELIEREVAMAAATRKGGTAS